MIVDVGRWDWKEAWVWNHIDSNFMINGEHKDKSWRSPMKAWFAFRRLIFRFSGLEALLARPALLCGRLTVLTGCIMSWCWMCFCCLTWCCSCFPFSFLSVFPHLLLSRVLLRSRRFHSSELFFLTCIIALMSARCFLLSSFFSALFSTRSQDQLWPFEIIWRG